MYTINYFIDSTDNTKERTCNSVEELSNWINKMFKRFGSRLVVTSIRTV